MGSEGPVSLSAMLTRDVIRHVTPTLIAVAFLQPFTSSSMAIINVEALVTVALLSGFFVTALAGQAVEVGVISSVMSKLYLTQKGDEPNSEVVGNAHEWWSANWDYDRLFFSLDKDDREYTYLTYAYRDCFELISFFFFLYCIINTLLLVGRSIVDLNYNVFEVSELFTIRTSLLYGSAPTVLVILVAYLFFNSMTSWTRAEERALIWDGGIYPEFAARQQRKEGGLARGIWGWVRCSDKLLPGARVHLLCNGAEIGVQTSNSEGRFQFPINIQEILGKTCSLNVEGYEPGRSFTLDEKSVPEYSLDVKPGDASASR